MPDVVALPLALIAAGCIFAWIFAASFFAFGAWARVKVDEVRVGFGPALVKRVVRGIPIVIALLPLSAYATIRGMNPYVEAEPPEPPLELWANAPKGRRILGLLLAPRLLPFVVGAALVGPRAFVEAAVTGVGDYFGALHAPLPLLDRAAEQLHARGFAALIGLALAKLLAWHLLQLVPDLGRVFSRDEKSSAKIFALVQLAMMGIGIAWVVGFVRWSIHSR